MKTSTRRDWKTPGRGSLLAERPLQPKSHVLVQFPGLDSATHKLLVFDSSGSGESSKRKRCNVATSSCTVMDHLQQTTACMQKQVPHCHALVTLKASPDVKRQKLATGCDCHAYRWLPCQLSFQLAFFLQVRLLILDLKEPRLLLYHQTSPFE